MKAGKNSIGTSRPRYVRSDFTSIPPVTFQTETRPGSATGEFDDIVVYLSLNQLFNRMIMGGALP
jgi:hypothetical protein